ncbi:MAG: YbhB/YbcL family Raf kinase inhibitor-like protein, partial [Spirochaetes bacterium]|nr:YbhB/YbcL family Raf kinase inhibitor-like protein [Spirochaetota bacterium]
MSISLTIFPTNSHSDQKLTLKSSAFLNNGYIPQKYTCEGLNQSIPLEWSGAPAKTKSFALVVDDPDAQKVVGYTWVHWV